MAFYASYPIKGGGGSGVAIYPNVASFPATATTGSLAVDASTGNLYEFNGTSWVQIAGPGAALALGNLDSQAPTAQGAALVNGTLSMQSADATYPGLVNNTAQSFSGQKTFTTGLTGTLTGHATLDLPLTGGTLSGVLDLGSNNINNLLDPTTPQQGATKNYVDLTLAGLQPQQAVQLATTANIPATYNNGTSGVGATLTVIATGVLTIDSVPASLGYRVLIKNQTAGAQNGIYVVTIAGAVGVSAVLTRAANYDTAADMNAAGLIPVLGGSVNAVSSWQQVATVTTVGTDSLVFTEFTANPSLYLIKANNLSDVASTTTAFNNISPITSVGDLIIGTGVSTAGFLTIGANATVLTSNGTTASWQTIPALTLAAVGSSPNADGATLASNVLTLQPADGSNPGLMTAGAQSFGGAKTFNSTVAVATSLTSPIIYGSSASAGTLAIKATSNATAGIISLNSAGGNVGIGTASPSAALHIVANSTGSTARMMNTNVTGYTAFDLFDSTTTQVGGFGYGNASAGVYPSQIYLYGASKTISFGHTGGAQDLVISGTSGSVGIGVTSPSAKLTLMAGTATASSAPLKFTSGTNLSTPEAGAVEFNGTDLFYTTSTPTRRTVVNLDASQTLTNKIISGAANTITNISLTTGVTGVLPIANGGTNNGSLAVTAGGVIYSDGSKLVNVGAGVSNQYLKSNGGSAPSWATGVPGSTAPTVQRFLSGTGTYTTPVGVLYIKVTMVGGGGGGGGGGSTAGTAGTTGGTTTFGSSLLTATGGAAGGNPVYSTSAGAGGTVTINPPAIIIKSAAGARGGEAFSHGAVFNGSGATGGVSPFGGAGSGLYAGTGSGVGTAAAVNSGSGGGGGSGTANSGVSDGSGGGAGGYLESIIPSPSGTYAYAVGAAGTAMAGGTNGYPGGAGGSGIIIVEEFYQ